MSSSNKDVCSKRARKEIIETNRTLGVGSTLRQQRQNPARETIDLRMVCEDIAVKQGSLDLLNTINSLKSDCDGKGVKYYQFDEFGNSSVQYKMIVQACKQRNKNNLGGISPIYENILDIFTDHVQQTK